MNPLPALTRSPICRATVRLAAAASFFALLTFIADASHAAGFQTIPVPDPTVGMSEGQLPILPGWHGNATVDRTSDPLGNGTAALSIDVQSPDGTRGFRALPVAFHTFSPAQRQMGIVKPQQPGAYVMFSSTAELLTREIMPRLNLSGETSAPFAIDREKLAQTAMKLANGQTPPFTDAAAVIVKTGNGQEIMVEATTFGSARGTSGEMSATNVHLYRAPAGQARALHDELAQLPVMQPEPQWIQADRGLYEQKMAALRRQNEQIQQQTANNNAAFENWKRTSSAQRAQYDQHNAAWARRQQATSDSNAAFAGYVGDHDVSYKWCNGSTGAVQYVTNSAQSPGAGFQRCS